ncbi:MAG: hypothetical protein E7421_00425 [Ruminococcaceae bacterium]|nr:hypothetical protein [Oscillospiraceae bacterium]
MNYEMNFAETEMAFTPAFGEVTAIGTGGKGTVFIPTVSEEGVISWSNDGGLPNPEPVSIKGADGYTPVKGTDYWTAAEKSAMVADVIAALPVYKGEVV